MPTNIPSDDIMEGSALKEMPNPPETTIDSEEDVAARFADLQSDARLKVSEQYALPDPPKMDFVRPVLKKTTFIPPGRYAKVAPEQMRNFGLAASAGWTLFGAVIGGIVLGMVVDKFLLKNPPTPWGLIIGFFVGLVVGFMQLARILQQMNRKEKRD